MALAFSSSCVGPQTFESQLPRERGAHVVTPALARPEVPAPVLDEPPAQLRRRLLDEHDLDCDQRITKLDQGNRSFQFRLSGHAYELSGSYALSNLLQELSLALRSGAPPRVDRVLEPPIERTSRLIRTEYWPALTRQIDEGGVPRVLEDPKLSPVAERMLYVPGDDRKALDYFQRVAERYDAAYAKLARTTASLPLSELIEISASEEKQRVLIVMLRTTEGRDALTDASRRLAEVAKTLDYPALSRHLSGALERIDELLEQAGRACVQLSTVRLGRIAERAANELGAFSPRKLSVHALPAPETWPEWTASLGARHGPLTLALNNDPKLGISGVPFVVPGGRFDEMYGWDSYFILLGLLADDRLDLARGLVDNFVYAIEHYKMTLNANRTYYLTRSQPPFLTSMIRAVWEATPAAEQSGSWLRRAVDAALFEYDNVWSSNERRVAALCRGKGDEQACLTRYAGRGRGQPPEVEPGHFNWLWQQLGRSLESSYASGRLSERNLTAELDSAFRHDRCMRESGHDTTYRWFWKADDGSGEERWSNRCADMVTVDLNSLLYRYEVDIAHLLRQLYRLQVTAGVPGTGNASLSQPAPPWSLAPAPKSWCARAHNRFELMKRHLWSPREGMFYDAYLSASGPTQTGYISATTLYPLWATAQRCEVKGTPPVEDLSAKDKSLLVTTALSQLEAPGGLLATARASRDRFSSAGDRQWEYPNGWAPHQILAWQGLAAHGFREDAQRLSFAWLYTLLSNVIDYNGTIPEKYDVVARTHAVFSEYGNVGTEFDYIASEGFGWMNASFQVGLGLLSPAERKRLAQSVAER
jgi:alpha,alpha-trehalase